MHPTDALIAVLHAAGIGHVFNPQPAPSPGLPSPYVAVVDDPGVAVSHRMSVAAHWSVREWRLIVVSRSLAGLRTTVAQVDAALAGARLSPDFPPLVQVEAGPTLTDGPEGDTRMSQTLIYRTHTRRNP